MATYEIVSTEKVFSANPLRQGMVDRLIIYRGEDQLNRIAFTPDETYTIERAQEAVRKAEAERRPAAPHRFTV